MEQSKVKQLEKSDFRQENAGKTRFRQVRPVLQQDSFIERQAGGCTFCGAVIEPGETECEECGMPVAGLKCPVCGAISHNSFCSRCNTPLNRMAKAAVEKARQDPKFQQVCLLVEKAEKLKKRIGTAQAPQEQARQEMDEGARAMLELMGGVKFTLAEEKDARAEYEQAIRDIDKLFSEMLPPAGSTPQQQQNYYSARHICVTTVTENKVTIKTPVAWICNFCGCRHNQPSECAEPYLGGKWEYQTTEVTERTVTKEIKIDE